MNKKVGRYNLVGLRNLHEKEPAPRRPLRPSGQGSCGSRSTVTRDKAGRVSPALFLMLSKQCPVTNTIYFRILNVT